MKLLSKVALLTLVIVTAQQVMAVPPPPVPDAGSTGILAALSIGAMFLGKNLIRKK